MLPIISEKSNNNMTNDVSLEELPEEVETNETMTSSELNPEIIAGLKELLQTSQNQQEAPTPPWMPIWNPHQYQNFQRQ